MKILITGVAGLLGSRLADWLIQNVQDCKIIGLDDLSGGYRENVHPDVEFVEINLTNRNALNKIFREHNPDYVYHFAAYAAEGL